MLRFHWEAGQACLMASKLKAVSARKGTKSAKVQPALANTTVHGSCMTMLPDLGARIRTNFGMPVLALDTCVDLVSSISRV